MAMAAETSAISELESVTDAVTKQAPSRRKRKAAMCGVCTSQESRYKCARCLLPYCSIACSKCHTATHTNDTPPVALPVTAPPPTPAPQPQRRPAADSAFARLANSVELKLLFTLYPNLARMLEEINSAMRQPTSGDGNGRRAKARKEPAWTTDRGIECGVKALARARMMAGRDGEGLREYMRLVLHMVNSESKQDQEQNLSDGDPATLIHRELIQQDMKVIEVLLHRERC